MDDYKEFIRIMSEEEKKIDYQLTPAHAEYLQESLGVDKARAMELSNLSAICRYLIDIKYLIKQIAESDDKNKED